MTNQIISLTGYLTSSIKKNAKSNGPAYGFFQLEDDLRNQDQETPIIFRIREKGEWIIPSIATGSKVKLQGEWVDIETAKSKKSQRQSFTCQSYEIIESKEKVKKPKLETLIEEAIRKHQSSKRNNQKIIREIKQECSSCQNIYQLLEIHKIDIAIKNEDDRCSCLDEWKKILAEYFQKELADYLNNLENETPYYDE